MANDFETEKLNSRRVVAPAKVSSKTRGRPIADLVEELEKSGQFVSKKGGFRDTM